MGGQKKGQREKHSSSSAINEKGGKPTKEHRETSGGIRCKGSAPATDPTEPEEGRRGRAVCKNSSQTAEGYHIKEKKAGLCKKKQTGRNLFSGQIAREKGGGPRTQEKVGKNRLG